MERLTYDFCLGDIHCWQVKGADNLECCQVCEEQEDGCNGCPIALAFDRLAAYEDTGLTPEEVQQMRWIPVEDRLPEKGDWVLAAYRGKGGKPLVEIAIYNPKTKVHKRGGEVYVVLEGWYRNRDWSVCDMILDQVTHWIPLPKLPKEEKK